MMHSTNTPSNRGTPRGGPMGGPMGRGGPMGMMSKAEKPRDFKVHCASLFQYRAVQA
jgi:hypothetical protein